MQLSKYLKRICEFFSTFPKSTENFEHFGKNDENQRFFFFNYRLKKTRLLKCVKSTVSEHLRAVNMLKA